VGRRTKLLDKGPGVSVGALAELGNVTRRREKRGHQTSIWRCLVLGIKVKGTDEKKKTNRR